MDIHNCYELYVSKLNFHTSNWIKDVYNWFMDIHNYAQLQITLAIHNWYLGYPFLWVGDYGYPYKINVQRKKGRLKKTWSECTKTGVKMCGLAGVDPLNRDAWRASVWHSLPGAANPNRIGHGQHLNLSKDMDGMEGWIELRISITEANTTYESHLMSVSE